MASSSFFMNNSMDSFSQNRTTTTANTTSSSSTITSSWGFTNYINSDHQIGLEIPKFKSLSPSSLPLSPPPVSPSSFLSIPPSGLSPGALLDSPVLFSNVSFFIFFQVNYELYINMMSYICMCMIVIIVIMGFFSFVFWV